MTKKERIWELDAARGLFILFMVGIHFTLDLQGFDYYGSWLFNFIRTWGSVLFLLLSGICVTLGHRALFRGAVVFGAGLLCTLVTWGMTLLGFSGPGMVIWFGILHCLGICMLLWPLFQKLPIWAVALAALLFLGVGYWFATLQVETRWLFPFGLTYPGFSSADYFPLFPNLGWFLAGAVLGKTLYREKKTLFPNTDPKAWPIRALSWCGRQSLFIYLLHQPILTGLVMLFRMI